MPNREPSPNVYGIETEYSALITFPGNKEYEIVGECHSPDVELGLYQTPNRKSADSIPTALVTRALRINGLFRNTGDMISNGGRFYVDPSGFEYATPETSTAEDAVHRSYDGDEILLGVLGWLQEKGKIENFQVNRKIVDHNRTSRGVHLNTSINWGSNVPGRKFERWLATLNVVKGAMFGSGGLLINHDRTTTFHHSPRLSLTNDIATGGHTRRPLLRVPFKADEPHGRLKRVETTCSDALNFAWPMRASLVATNALIGAIELGHGMSLPKLRDPVEAARVVGEYGYERPILVIDGDGSDAEEMPLDVLRRICEFILLTDDKEGYLDDESDQVIGEIIDVADRMSVDPYSVATQVESIARLMAIEKKRDRDKIELDSDRMCRFDYAWDWIGGRGIAEGLRNRNLAGWHGFSERHSPGATKKRILFPPQDTRAKFRGDIIKERRGNNASDWSMIDTGSEKRYMHPLSTAIL